MNRLKAAGAAVAGALLLGVVIVAVNGLSGAGASGPAANLAPHVGSAQGLPANEATICAGCTSPFNQEADTLDSALNGGAVGSADLPVTELGPPQAFASTGCCNSAQPLTTGSAKEAKEAGGDNAFAGMPFSALAMAGAALRDTGAMARRDGLFDGGDTAGVASGSGSNGDGTIAPAGGAGDAADDVLASINPDSGERSPVSTSEPAYCINPTGVYCGEGKETDGPVTPDTAPSVVMPWVVDPLGTLPEQGQRGSEDALNDVPEPFTLALMGIGFASFRAARRK